MEFSEREDITWIREGVYSTGKQGLIFFANGYGASILNQTDMSITDESHPYEVALIKMSYEEEWHLPDGRVVPSFDLVADEKGDFIVFKYLTSEQATEVVDSIHTIKETEVIDVNLN